MFAHELALELGCPSVERMLSEMSASEFNTWQAYWQVRPFGERINQLMLAQIAAILINANRQKGSAPVSPADLVPKTKPPSLKEQVIAVFSRFKGRKRVQ